MTQNEDIKSLETACLCALKLSGQTQGRGPVPWSTIIASIAFARLGIHGASILRLSPESSFHTAAQGMVIWDLPSVSSLSRNLIETYFVLHYFVAVKCDVDHVTLREQVWRYHEACERLKMLQVGVPDSTKLGPKEAEKRRLKQLLESNSLFQQLPKDKKNRIIRGEKSRLLSNEELCSSAGISQNFYNSLFKHGSNHTHSSPFSFSEMDSFRANDESARRAFSLPLRFSTAFIALGIRDFLQTCPDQIPHLNEREKELIDVWSEVVKWDKSQFFNQIDLKNPE